MSGSNASWVHADVAHVVHPFWVADWSLLAHMEVLDCSLWLFVAAILCSAAGIGGGGVYVAVLMIAGNLEPHDAVPISKAVVFLGAVVSLFLNMRRAQQVAAPVIDFTVCSLVIPASLIGTLLGVHLNHVVAGGTIVVLLTLVLVAMTFFTAREALGQLRAEAREKELVEAVHDPEEIEGLVGPATPDRRRSPKWAPTSLFQPQAADWGSALLALLAVVSSGIAHFHLKACRAEMEGVRGPQLGCSHPIFTVFGHLPDSWVSAGRAAQMVEFVLVGVPLGICVSMMVHYSALASCDLAWDRSRIAVYQSIAMVTGLLAGLVGVGGGVVFAPMFLLSGMDPAVAVATSSTCVLFTSSSTTFQYLFTDRIAVSLALLYGVVNATASALGTALVHVLQDRFAARRSIISFILVAGMALSVLLTLVKLARLRSEHPIGHTVMASLDGAH